MPYNDKINGFLLQRSASLIGYADISILPDSQTHEYPYGIAIGIALDTNIIKNIPSGPHMEYYNHYREVSDKLNNLTEELADFIKSLGYSAYPQSRANVSQDENYRTALPHKTICTLSGLGWIGKSALLINSEYGGAVRYYTLLTDIPVVVGTPIAQSKCGDCIICHQQCPASAINTLNWDTSVNRDDLLDAGRCKKTKIERGKKIGGTKDGSCGICIAVCPYTQGYINRALQGSF